MEQQVTKSDILGLSIGGGLASWNQPRTHEQLLDFIAMREQDIYNTEA